MIKTVLSIEDDSSTQFLNRLFLTESGFCNNMVEAYNGIEALTLFEKLEKGEEEKIPQLILLDINMPLMGGWEFLDRFETKFPQFAKVIPIIILSSTINPEDKIKAKNDKRVIGMLGKPLDFEQIDIAKKLLTA